MAVARSETAVGYVLESEESALVAFAVKKEHDLH